MPYAENVIIIGDMNGHIGTDRTGIENILGAFSIGDRNREGENIIDFCVENQMSIMNTFYNQRESKKWIWYIPFKLYSWCLYWEIHDWSCNYK